MNAQDAPLPEILEATLDREGLEEYLAALGREATGLTLRRRSAPGALEGGAAVEALARLLRGAATTPVQVRYEAEGRRWIDTLMPAPDGYRLVRMAEG